MSKSKRDKVTRNKPARKTASKTKASRGASLKRERFLALSLPRMSRRFFVVLGLLCSVGSLSYFAYLALNNATQRPIQSVAVEGDFSYVSEEEVADILNPIIVDGFLQLPLMAVKEKLEDHPWIARVNVSRRWPDTLMVDISEQIPIARWGEIGFLNQHGEIILVEQTSEEQTPVLASLPWLDGDKASAKVLMQRYQQFTQLLRPHGLNIVTFQADETNDLTVVLDNGLLLYVGKDEVMEKFQRFVLVFQHSLKDRLQEVVAVDLRYNNGLAVRWQTTETQQSDSIFADPVTANTVTANTVADSGVVH